MKKFLHIFLSIFILMNFFHFSSLLVEAKGTTYYELQDVYYTKAGCIVYAEPTYTSQVLVTLDANIPVRVVGYYANGWYRINIGVIAYCKMDSLTSAGDVGIITDKDLQAVEAKKIADALGYEFHYLKLNKEKVIKKDIFNSYINKKAILFARIDENLAVLFKMVYPDKVKKDINLNYTLSRTEVPGGSSMKFTVPEDTTLLGQIAIFQIQVGFDKSAEIYVNSVNGGGENLMNTYFTEFDRFAYAPMTQVSDFRIEELEMLQSLNDNLRTKMYDIKRGIKYLSYDEKNYRSSIGSRLRKETEYIDYSY